MKAKKFEQQFDEDVDLTEGFNGGAEHLPGGLRVGRIGRNADGLTTSGPDGLDGLVQLGLLARGQHHAGALAGEQLRGRQADALAGTRHDGGLCVE